MTADFHRIRRLPPYVFEEANRLMARLRGEGRVAGYDARPVAIQPSVVM